MLLQGIQRNNIPDSDEARDLGTTMATQEYGACRRGMEKSPLPSVSQHIFSLIFKEQKRITSNLDHYFMLITLEFMSLGSYQTQLNIQK